jgi:hypothetical protein
MTWFGILGALCLALCGVPQLLQVLRDGHARGTSAAFLGMWGGGCASMLVNVLLLHASDIALVLNYVLNLFVVGMICLVKWRAVR